MKKSVGSFMTGVLTIVTIVLLIATALLVAVTIRERNITKAEALLRGEEYAEAFEVFKKADKYSLRPDIRVVRGLAVCSLGLQDYEAATHHYETLINIDPDNVEAHFTLGLLYIRSKNFGAAEKEIGLLRKIGTRQAVSGAEELSSHLQSGMVKGFFLDLFKKIAPSFPKIPGLTEDEPIETQNAPAPNFEPESKDN